MSRPFSRRFVLAGLAAGAAGRVWADAPETSPRPRPRGKPPAPPGAAALIREAGLGGSIGYLAVNAETGAVLDAVSPRLRLPPASVTKAATAHYALSHLGGDFRFETRLLATGPVENGRLLGDLVLSGGGDPALDTDALGEMAAALRALGIHEVTGRLRLDASRLPTLPFIDPDQPDHVGYNPAISGLNLNYNRVHFEWKRGGSGYDITMQARARKFRPGVSIARMAIADRAMPVYTYEDDGGIDRWTVARRALGREGARWLPVRRPADYAAEVFQTLARSHGIALKRGPDAPGADGTPLVSHQSPPLAEMMADMLKYSTNLTAESTGLTVARRSGLAPASLIRSAREMNLWFNRDLGTTSCGFVDHSGLGYGSRVSAEDMVHLLRVARQSSALGTLMKEVKTETPGISVRAKTGTLNFVSALAGYVDAPGKPPIAFAIFTADMPRRDAIRVEERERPPGARGWARRSRKLQKDLIGRWVALAGA